MPEDLVAFLATLPLVASLTIDQPSKDFLCDASTEEPNVEVGPDSIGMWFRLSILM